MTNPIANDRHLHYYKRLKEQLEAHTTKASSNALRRRWLKRQKVANYQNEHERLRNALASGSILGGARVNAQERVDYLKTLGATAVDGIQD